MLDKKSRKVGSQNHLRLNFRALRPCSYGEKLVVSPDYTKALALYLKLQLFKMLFPRDNQELLKPILIPGTCFLCETLLAITNKNVFENRDR